MSTLTVSVIRSADLPELELQLLPNKVSNPTVDKLLNHLPNTGTKQAPASLGVTSISPPWILCKFLNGQLKLHSGAKTTYNIACRR